MKQGKFLAFHEEFYDFKGAKDEATVVEAAKSADLDPDRLAKDVESSELQKLSIATKNWSP